MSKLLLYIARFTPICLYGFGVPGLERLLSILASDFSPKITEHFDCDDSHLNILNMFPLWEQVPRFFDLPAL